MCGWCNQDSKYRAKLNAKLKYLINRRIMRKVYLSY